MTSLTVLLLSILLLSVPTFSLSFTLYEGGRRCFVEELPPHTLVRLHYTTEDTSPNALPNPDGIYKAHLVVLDPSGRTISSSSVKSQGQVVYTATLGGIYEMCFIGDAASWFKTVTKLRITAHVDVGHSAINYKDIAKQEELDALSLSTRQLADGVEEIVQVQQYLSQRETEMRVFTEKARSRVSVFNFCCVLVMTGSTLLQVYYMKSYLKKRLKW
ncbi:hypothetical protein GEMRC1_008562 [Eukaryota sp. GEM-RC1]